MYYRSNRKTPWVVQYTCAEGKDRGKIKTASFIEKKDAKEFEDKMSQANNRVKHGLEAPCEEILFLDFSISFLHERYKDYPKSSIDQENTRLRKYWIPVLGAKPLMDITSGDIQKVLDSLRYEHDFSNATYNRNRTMMNIFFKRAIKKKKCKINPVTEIELLEENESINRKNYFKKAEDQEKYVNAMYGVHSKYGIVVDIMIWTGARICSAIPVQWQDVYFDRNQIEICRLLERADRKNPIKNRDKGQGQDGNIILPLFPALKESLRRHYLASPFKKPTDFIACNDQGGTISYERFMDVHNQVIKEAKLPKVTPHGIRRGFATNAKRAGYTRNEIREMMGLSTERVLDRYDIKDVDHLYSKGQKLGFGAEQSNIVKLKEGN